jgi:hypothetical protein
MYGFEENAPCPARHPTLLPHVPGFLDSAVLSKRPIRRPAAVGQIMPLGRFADLEDNKWSEISDIKDEMKANSLRSFLFMLRDSV